MADVVERRTVSLEAAQRVLAAALAEAAANGPAVCIAVTGRSGQLVAYAAMDDAPDLSASIARDKAWTVASFHGVPTHEWWSMIGNDPALVHGITKVDRLMVFGGGVPLHVGGELVGAIGVSGGSADDDRRIAEAGAAALG